MMRLFSRWKKRETETLTLNNKPIFIGNKHGLFDDIVGFDDVKSLFEMAIEAERPVHLLLCGPPASAKSLFMRSLTKLERSYYAVGSSSTKSGIFDYLFEHRPLILSLTNLKK
jgi:Holliday junction DNA helicase RuvB